MAKTGLGKGLSALLANNSPLDNNNDSTIFERHSERIHMLNIDSLQKGRYQPRKDIDQETLKGLADSISQQGILEPIIVRFIGCDKYEIAAGERRWRAAKLAGLLEVPCIIKSLSDQETMLISLLENIQREDLNVMEEAEALQIILDNLTLTHEELAQKVGKSRSNVSNLLRLNSLVEDVKELLRRGDMEMGHARALLSLDENTQKELALTIVQKGLSVRDTERLVSNILHKTEKKTKKISDEVMAFTAVLKNKLGDMDFKYVNNGKDKGKITLSFKNQEELNKIKNLLGI
jgi:ParB family chromosome partitioning protein